MSNTVEQIKGTAEVVNGQIEKTIGKALGNERMQREGNEKVVEGTARQAVASAAAAKDAAQVEKDDAKELKAPSK